MLKDTDLDAPARLRYRAAGARKDAHEADWSKAREFPSLREALHRAMNEEPPAGEEPVIRAASGMELGAQQLEEIWLSVQGP